MKYCKVVKPREIETSRSLYETVYALFAERHSRIRRELRHIFAKVTCNYKNGVEHLNPRFYLKMCSVMKFTKFNKMFTI